MGISTDSHRTDRHHPDDALVAAIGAGDAAALAHLYDRWSAPLFGLALRITREKASAEDAVAATFAQAWRDASHFAPGTGSVGAWLAAIARRRGLELSRTGHRRDHLGDTAVMASEPDLRRDAATRDGTAQVHDNDRARRVRAALDSLTEQQRAALELVYFDGLSGDDVARRFDEAPETTRTRLRLALRRLRELLQPLGPPEGA